MITNALNFGHLKLAIIKIGWWSVDYPKFFIVIYFALAHSAKNEEEDLIYNITYLIHPSILGANHPFISHNLLSYFAIVLKLSAFLRHYFPFPILTLPSFSSTSFFKIFSFSPSNLSLQILSTLFSFILFLYIWALFLLFFLFP